MAQRDAQLLIWIDAQLPPVLTQWIEDADNVHAIHVSELGLLSADDPEIFKKARSAKAVVMTKDEDFVHLQEQCGVPPQLVWITCGNATNSQLKVLLLSQWERVVDLLRGGEPLVEVNGGRIAG